MTNTALEAGIDACGPGRPFNWIGKAIYEVVRNTRYSVCPAFAGHGIGTVFHRPPWIYHTCKSIFGSCVKDVFEIFFAVNEEPGVMLPGHCFTIEANSSAQCRDPLLISVFFQPSLVQGSNPSVWIFPDGWTASTEVRLIFYKPKHFLNGCLEQNCARSAQAEHMILITETGVDVLTQ